MTERVGRHAAPRGSADELVPEAELRLAHSGDGKPAHYRGRPAGRHAAPGSALAADPNGNGRAARGDDPAEPPARTPQNGHGPADLASPDAGPSASTARAPAAGPAAGPAHSGAGHASRLRLVWVYPDLLSTYGDRGNLLVLQRRARLRGIDVDAVGIDADQPVPAQGDIYLLGGGEDLPQILAANRLRADGGLATAASLGSVVFAVCAGYQVIGHQFGGVEGEPVSGLGLLDISSGRGQRRGVGELTADVDPELGVPRLTGFENHQGITHIGPGARPLARVSRGVGNGDGTEGAFAGKVLGTYLHGPALARNPGLADLLLSWVIGPLAPIDPVEEEWAARLRAERLAAVPQ
jgi:lipid II isoglutaminyl synthase (glutamine-hydrolysing)